MCCSICGRSNDIFEQPSLYDDDSERLCRDCWAAVHSLAGGRRVSPAAFRLMRRNALSEDRAD